MVVRLLIAWALIACAVRAQHAGTVRSSGLPVPGATVTITQAEQKFVTSTDEQGRYSFPKLVVTAATASVSLFGFETVTREISGAEAEWELALSAPRAAAPPPATRARRATAQLALSRTADADRPELAEPTAPEPVLDAPPEGGTEAFLVNGSLSQGVQFEERRPDFFPGGGMGPGGDFGGPMRGPGPFGGDGGDGSGGSPPGGGSGMGPSGGPPGGPGSMGRGGPPGAGGFGGRGGPPGGFGGPGGPGGPRGARGRGGFEETARGPKTKEKGAKKAAKAERTRPEWAGRRGVSTFGNRRARRDQIRGQASFSLSNSAFDARQYSLTGQRIEKPSYARARLNLSLGGQLRIPKLFEDEKTFFFLNVSGSRSRNPYSAVRSRTHP